MTAMPGGATRSSDRRGGALVTAALLAVLLPSQAPAPELYRYRDETGARVFSDRVPPGVDDFRRETLPGVASGGLVVSVRREAAGDRVRLVAENQCPCPVQVAAWLTRGRNTRPGPGEPVVVLLGPRATATLVQVASAAPGRPAEFEFDYGYVLGDPDARHAPEGPYRPPFAKAQTFQVTQAWPDTVTHDTPDSRHAVDIAMPVGTPVYAARGGVVATVEYGYFRGGADRAAYGAQANHVRILHEDGTFGLYAHLRRDSVRVRPGQRVSAGEPIGFSGNTGFSTGPHLHFAVLRNAGLEAVSEPVVFADGRGGSLRAVSGRPLANP